MTLLDKTVRLSLLTGAALLFTACPPSNKCDSGEVCDSAADTDTDADADSDTDADADTDTDTEPAGDTGLMYVAFRGNINTSAGEFVDGSVGYGFIGMGPGDAAGEWTCVADGALEYEGEGPAGCPDCEWAFDLSQPTGTTATGDYCAQFGFDTVDDTFWGDGFDYGWGFTYMYPYVYGGSTFELEDGIMLYSADYGWFLFAYNYSYERVYGDAEALSFVRPAFSGGSYVYYYYYPY